MAEEQKKIPCGIGLLAHVDAGKTTLSEAMLFSSGARRSLGRVDRRDTLLDSDAQERERGITIYSKQARFSTESLDVTLVDTPGHVDFSSEAERVMPVLDCAVLVISGTEGVQAHTVTLWNLLKRYRVPVFLFVNKMDLAQERREALMEALQTHLDPGCVDFGQPMDSLAEAAALCDEALLETYLQTGQVTQGNLRGLIAGRRIFPCRFGSALKLEGVAELLADLEAYAPRPSRAAALGAQVYKITYDPQGVRLTWLKLTGGTLRVRDPLTYRNRQGDPLTEKITQLRLYSGDKFTAPEAVEAGTLCAVAGLTATWAGQGLGAAPDALPPVTEPVMTYRLQTGVDPALALPKLKTLEEEDPQLRVLFDQATRQIRVQVMGRVQREVLLRALKERFGLDASLDNGRVYYKETIAAPVEGVGHYEPLRHYAEVHLLLEPLPRGTGLVFDTACSTDVLDVNYQRLILTHLREKTHLGVLTGGPITDMRLTLLIGKAHLKHTEGGDFRQATYRAVRQGLMKAESVLLEPWYDFVLTLPAPQLGRAITDLRAMGGTIEPPETIGQEALLRGRVPAGEVGDYPRPAGGLHPGSGPAPAHPRRLRSVPQRPGSDRSGGLRSPGGFGQFSGLYFLRPRGGLRGKMGPGARIHAPGQRLWQKPRPRHSHPEPGRRRQGAGGHHGAGIWPHQTPGLPGARHPPRHRGGGDPRAKGPVPDRGRVQRPVSVGEPAGNRPGGSGNRPAAADGRAEQLRRFPKAAAGPGF